VKGSEVPPAPRSAAYLAGLAQLVDQIPAVAWSTDADLVFTSSAGGALEALRLHPGEVVGMSLAEYFGTDDPAFPPIAAHRRALAGESVAFPFEWAGRCYETRVAPLRAVNGAVVGTVGLALDVTDRRHAEVALATSEAHYRALVDEAPLGIFRTSAEGRFLSVNPALVAMLGYRSAAELLGLDLAADVYVDPDLRSRLTSHYAHAERVSGVDVEWRRKDGSAITVRLAGRPVRRADGSIECWEMIAEDVTGRRQLEGQLRQAQKMEAVGRLTGGLAHDFNNILTTILTNAELVAAALPPAVPEVHADLGEIVEAARRGGDLVKKLLGFSRRERLEILPTNLPQVTAELLAARRDVVPGHVQVAMAPAPADLPPVLADTDALEHILVNLVANARDAMPRGGTISLGFERARLDETYRAAHGWGTPGNYVALVVRDTGAGMDEATRSRAFEPFFTTKPPGSGSGLGLPMVYGLMKQMNGFVRLESDPGRGTRVTLFFPVAARGRERKTPEGSAAAAPPPGAVLVVEDEEPIRRVAERVLRRFGYRVLVAANGEEALEVWRQRRGEIGLVLTDVVMPRMGGRELYETLRGQGATVPFAFTSGHITRGEFEGEAGGLDPSVPFLAKPWSIEQLVALVRQTVAAHGSA
jgi:PAS domain S-box-containing protein